MAILLKALLYLGILLLIGAGLFPRFIAPEAQNRAVRRGLWLGLAVGALLVTLTSAADLPLTLQRVLGRVDLRLVLDYLQHTRHGVLTQWRFWMVAALLLLGPATRLPRLLDRGLFVAAGLGLLYTVSALSHAAAMGGGLPVLADMGHLCAAALWGGSLLYLAWLPVWTQADASLSATERLSWVGFLSILALVASGVYASILHLSRPSDLFATDYGRALDLKYVAVLLVLAVAGTNRWLLLPALRKHGVTTGLRHMLRIESVLLVVVLAATGLLTTREPAHEHLSAHAVDREAGPPALGMMPPCECP